MTTEQHQQLNFLCSMPVYGNTTMTSKDLRQILLDTGGSVMACGNLYNIIAQSIGAGVYKVTLKLAYS